MYMSKQDDGTYATTPFCVGPIAVVEKFDKAWKTCPHDWQTIHEESHPKEPRITMAMQHCGKCNGSRALCTGEQKVLDDHFEPLRTGDGA